MSDAQRYDLMLHPTAGRHMGTSAAGEWVKADDYDVLLAERDQLRAELEAIRGQQAVATLLPSDPYDERPGFYLSLEDKQRLADLPAGTKLYALPPQQPDAVSVPRKLAEAVRELIGAANSVNRSRMHEVRGHDDDQPRYWQRKEWVDWLVENGEKAQQALDALSTKNAEEGDDGRTAD